MNPSKWLAKSKLASSCLINPSSGARCDDYFMSIRDTSDSNGLSKCFLHGVLQFTDLESLWTSDPSAKQNISQRCLTFLGYQRWISVGTSGSGWEQLYVIETDRCRMEQEKGVLQMKGRWPPYLANVNEVYVGILICSFRIHFHQCSGWLHKTGAWARTFFSQWGCFPTRKSKQLKSW